MSPSKTGSIRCSPWEEALGAGFPKSRHPHVEGHTNGERDPGDLSRAPTLSAVPSDAHLGHLSTNQVRTQETHTYTHRLQGLIALYSRDLQVPERSKTHFSTILQRKRNGNHLAKEDLHHLSWKPRKRLCALTVTRPSHLHPKIPTNTQKWWKLTLQRNRILGKGATSFTIMCYLSPSLMPLKSFLEQHSSTREISIKVTWHWTEID